MKKLLFILLLLTACTKEEIEPRLAQLSVESTGNYLITYGTSDPVKVKGVDKWTTTFKVNPGETIQLSVQTTETPATLYMSVEVQEGLLYCKSLYIEPQSVGSLNHIVDPN